MLCVAIEALCIGLHRLKKKQDIVIADHSVLNEHSHPLAMMSGNGCRLPLSDEVVSVRYGRLKDKISQRASLAQTH